jgi:hypothetical protein
MAESTRTNDCYRLERIHGAEPNQDQGAKKKQPAEDSIRIQSSDAQAIVAHSSSSVISTSSDIENKVAQAVDDKLEELKKMMSRVYALQKRTSGLAKVRYPKDRRFHGFSSYRCCREVMHCRQPTSW